MRRILKTTAGIGVLTILGLAAPSDASGQSNPCSMNADTAATHSGRVVAILAESDSTLLAAQGLPFRPAGGAVLVTNAVLCQALVDAYNAPLAPADTVRRIERAYVFLIGSSTYVVAADKPSLASSEVYIFFDASYNWLAGIAALE